MKRPGSGDPVVDAVISTSHVLRERANAELATCGLSLWTFKALRALDLLGPSRSIDVAEFLDIAARTVTGAVDALEAEGLVERRPHPTDRRARLVVLTPAGGARLAQACEVHQRFVARASAMFTAEQREQFVTLAAAIRSELQLAPAPVVAPAAQRT